MYCHASPTIPSIASKSCCPGMSRPKSINIHPALPELSRSACPDGLWLTLTSLHTAQDLFHTPLEAERSFEKLGPSAHGCSQCIDARNRTVFFDLRVPH